MRLIIEFAWHFGKGIAGLLRVWAGLLLLWLLFYSGGFFLIRAFPANITHADYEHALALWRVQRAQEYEMVITRGCLCFGTEFTLRVVDGKLDPAHSTMQGEPLTEIPASAMPSVQDLTVEGRFAWIDQRTRLNVFTNDSTTLAAIEFDPQQGYPRAITIHGTLWTPDTDTGSSYTVEKLTILRTAP
jgi:hypothetical protein